LAAPFPYFGGKSLACETVWAALGDPENYVEPFAGSAATLLGRPNAG
jgi:site-specific DNA-adenine methylase